MAVRDQMQADLTAAMKARDTLRTKVLRAALAAVANAEAVPTPGQDSGPWRASVSEVERKALTDADVRAVLTAELHELESTAGDLRDRGRAEEADELSARAAILAAYLRG